MWQRVRSYLRLTGYIIGLVIGTHSLIYASPESDIEHEKDSLMQILACKVPLAEHLKILDRLADLYLQTPDELYYLKQEYELALQADSIRIVYRVLHNIARYHYNGRASRDSLLYWCNKVDSIARSRNEYPNELFDVKSYSCLNLLWSKNVEMALNEAMALYQLASEMKHSHGLVSCAENMGLIYQNVRRDKDAVAMFEEGLDMLDKLDLPDNVSVQSQLSCYQAESSLRTPMHTQTDSILARYKRYIDRAFTLCSSQNDFILAKREYWMLYCYYANLYIVQNEFAKARTALEEASKYVGNVIAEGDYVQNVYLEVKALYAYRTGDPQQALRYLDEVLQTERLLENLRLKADILESLNRQKEALVLYDEIFQISSEKNNEAFLRQINQLQTMHDLFNKKVEARQAEFNQQRVDNRRRLVTAFSFVSVFLLLISSVLLFYYRRARSLKDELQCEKESLLESGENLVKAKLKAEEANHMKSAFLANMSHEIRTPLNAIVGFSGLLVDESSEEDEKVEYTRIIHNNTELLLNLVDDVLDLSRMETGDMTFKLKRYPLKECCQRSLDSVRHRIPAGVHLTFSPDPKPIIVITDMLRLQQLLTNLLTNSAKFTEKGEINLAYSLEEDQKQVRISVTDTGCGIPPEKQPAIFNRFEKLDDYKPGVGLGLSICTLITERLNGKIFIDGFYTQGARFVLIHPCEVDGEGYEPEKAE